MTEGGIPDSTQGRRGLPCSVDELAAAAALLLLPRSSSVSTASKGIRYTRHTAASEGEEEEKGQSLSSLASSCSSSCTADSSCARIADHALGDPLRLLAWAVGHLELKHKLARKSRPAINCSGSKTGKMNDEWLALLLQQENPVEDETHALSCLSSSSAARSVPGDGVPFAGPTLSSPPSPLHQSGGLGDACFIRSRSPSSPPSAASADASTGCGGSRSMAKMRRVRDKCMLVVDDSGSSTMVGGSSGMRRRAKAILELLRMRGGTSEVRIRAAVGDTPDTSKALRMLVKLEQVKRSGTGGRIDPFLYWVPGSGGGRTPRPSARLGTDAPVPPRGSC